MEKYLKLISKENKSVKILNADNIILSDETKNLCNEKANLKLFLIDSPSYRKAWYVLKYKFILKNL